MSWIKPTREDLTATISSEEIDAFSASADFSDVVDANLRRTVQLVRGYVRAGGVKLPADESLMPPSLLASAMDYAAYDLLKRFSVEIAEPRRRAREDALSIFKEVGAGRMAVEPHEDEDGSSAVAVAPMTAPPTPARLLD